MSNVNIEEKEVVTPKDIEEVENKEGETTTDKVETNSQADTEIFTIVVDGKESNFFYESYLQQRVTNLYLLIILIAIVVIFVLNKLYYYFKNIFTIKF